jgi:UDP-N-acetylglucosamine 2-epimerase (non-hydrolysing)
MRFALVCEALSYVSLARLLAKADLILSDSGGFQEGAPTFGVPVMVLREVTERTEAVDTGYAELVGSDPALIMSTATRILERPRRRCGMVVPDNPLGDGHAAERTVAALRWWLGLGSRPPSFVAHHR